MGTRSMIGVMHGDKCKAVYCHWDGYLSYNGRILQEHYDSPKANNLVALGDISSLKPEIGEKHFFSQFDTDMPAKEFEDKYGNMTTFYGRDRDEEGVEYKVYQDYDELLDTFDGSLCEFLYIMKDDVWYVADYDNRELRVLSEELVKDKETEEA